MSHEDDAAHRLAALATYYRQHPVKGPAGHSYISSEPRATQTAPGLPWDTGTDDHITRSITEVVNHTRAINPDAEPVPVHVANVYEWCRANTAAADADQEQQREALIYRQGLEHAIRAGDHSVIRPHRCPSCGAPGLFWQRHLQAAMCVNRHCARRNHGRHQQYSLAELAYEHVATKNAKKSSAG
ncbi:hypothetical protein HUT11_35385 (plasmid) [Streptomyces seoulensis]|nr:hypothetical protein HUT11_35385 [Streptomyces seoulensis]